jgi:hypothetical protein
MAKIRRNLIESINTGTDVLNIRGLNVVINDSVNITDTGVVSGLTLGALSKLALVPSPTSPVSAADGDHYYDSILKCLMYYDGTRSKWLSVESRTLQVGSNSAIGAGISLSSGGVLTSTSPITLDTNQCLVAISISTASTENWELTIEDVSGGSGNSVPITIDDGMGGSVSKFYKTDLNTNFNIGDTLDIYVSSLGTSGNVDKPSVQLTFKKRK